MKLRALSVNQFKRFIQPTRLGELSDGLNLVVGPNEVGKSTLLDALRAVLFERYSSGAQAIKALQNDRSGAAPVVELVFEVNDAEYTLTKRFVRSPYAQLRCPDGTLLEADAAEAKLRRLLGFDVAGNRGATPETLGMWGVLWVQQGQSFSLPDLPGSARESLSASLESEVGVVLGGRRARALPHVIEERRGELITAAQRRPRGEYKVALDAVAQLKQRLDGQQRRQLAMSETLVQLELEEARLKRLDEGNQDQIDQTKLTQAREQLIEVAQRESQLAAARSELENRQRQLEQGKRAQSERASLRLELHNLQEELRQRTGHLHELQEQERESSGALEQLRQALENAGAVVEAASQSEAESRFTLYLITSSAELSDLLLRQDDIAAARQRLDDARRQAMQIQVTDEFLQRIRIAAGAVSQATAQLNAVATRISFDVPADRLAGIEADGVPLTDASKTIKAVRPVVIHIPERGRILIDPAVADRNHLLRQQREAQAELDTALEQAGAHSLTEAEILRDQRHDLDATVSSAEEKLMRLASPNDSSMLQARIDELRQQQAALPSERRTARLPERNQAEATLRRAQTELQDAKDTEQAAQAALQERDRFLSERRSEVFLAQSAVDISTEMVQQREEQLNSDVEAEPDDQLAAAVDASERAVTEQQEKLSQLEEDESADARPQLEARIERLELAIEQRADLRASAQVEIATLRERIESRDSVGIDEDIGHTRHGVEQATRQRDHLEREISVLDLLSETLRTAENEAKERYLAPVLGRVRSYLQMLFPKAELSMDEDLKITGMARRGGYEESFDRLSMGTQEQIAVLVRLAFAEMLIDQGAPAAVLLDDALVFSDDQRMQLMFDILSHAAQRVQIVVFTCREQLFEGLGAYQLQPTPADPESLRSA